MNKTLGAWDTSKKCPMNCYEEAVNDTWYLSEVASSDAIPITIQEVEVVCDEKETTTSQPEIDCEKLLQALRAMGYNVETLSGLTGCTWSKPSQTSVRGLGRVDGLRGESTTVPVTPSISIPQLKEWLKATCPDKTFDHVTDAQLLALITNEMSKWNTSITYEQLQARIVSNACGLGKKVTGISQIPTWGLVLAGAGIVWGLTKI